MKQNSSILFHHMRKPLRISYLLQWLMGVCVTAVPAVVFSGEPDALPAIQSARAVRPIEADLPAIFRHIAESLEIEGSPVPYLRHVKAELSRVEHEYQTKYGRMPRSFCPAYMTDEYLDHLEANWNLLAPKLGLADLARQIGSSMRAGLSEKSKTAEILNRHQAKVFDFLAGRAAAEATFEELETDLLAESRQAGSHEAHEIADVTGDLFARLDRSLSVKDAGTLKAAISSVFLDVGRMAQAELEAGIVESAVAARPAQPYAVSEERALSAEEKEALTDLLSKPRFTKVDFAALERFYSGSYSRLSERGRDELSRRVWAGTRK